jgi:glycosyltransferase involved in cell wall biosynthesis
MSNTKRSPRVRVALAVIARNEEQFIAGCLDSARPFVDEIVVLDTGSTDRTVEIARAHGARVEHFTWCNDFAAARNVAIDAVTTDWVLMLDADERLTPESGPLLHQLPDLLPPNCHGFTMRIDSVHVVDTGEMSVGDRIPRFFPKRPDIRWIGAIHEDLRYIPDPQQTLLVAGTGLRAVHFGYDPAVYAARGKDQRNLDILQHAREQNPDDARMTYFTGQQHFANKRYAESLPWFSAFLESDHQLPASYDVEAFGNLLTAQFEVADFAGLRRTAEQAIARGAMSATSYLVLGQAAEAHGDIDQAVANYERTLDPNLPTGFTWDASVGSWRSRVRVALAEVLRGNFDRSLDYLEQSLVDAPVQQLANIASDAVRVTLLAGQPERGEAWLRRGIEYAGNDLEQQLKFVDIGVELAHAQDDAELVASGSPRLTEQAIARQDWQLAYESVMALDVNSAGGIARLVRVAASLREQGAADAALDLLSVGLDSGSGAGEQFYLLLMQTLKDLGRFDEALEVVQLLKASVTESLLAA